MRKFRHYDVGPAPGADADLKADSSNVTPARAWLMPQENDLPPGFSTDGGPWMMTIEDGPPSDSIVGEFEALVATAVTASVVEFFVWSAREHTYRQFDAETVRIVD